MRGALDAVGKELAALAAELEHAANRARGGGARVAHPDGESVHEEP